MIDMDEVVRIFDQAAESGAKVHVSRSLRPPKALDAIADVVLAYRPKPKSKPAKKRKRRASKIAKATQK